MKNVGPNNGLAETSLAFAPTEVIGFRAPYLAKGAGLYGALRSNGFRYDTSGVGHADAWPERIDGVWRFNLAMLRIAGSGKGTLSMDYNFFVAQSGAINDPRRYELAREQMLQTYLAYFKANPATGAAAYRASLLLLSGSQTRGLKSFARTVCGRRKCAVQPRRLADFMDGEPKASWPSRAIFTAQPLALNVAQQSP